MKTQIKSLWAVLLVLALLFVTVSAPFGIGHGLHHDCSGEGCPVCALVQDGLDISDNAPEVALFLVVICELTSQKCASKTNSHIHFYRPRGPPCLST